MWLCDTSSVVGYVLQPHRLLWCFLITLSSSGFYESLEETSHTRIVINQILGVPLYAQHKGVVWMLESLNQAIRRSSDHCEPMGRDSDPLVVRAVDWWIDIGENGG